MRGSAALSSSVLVSFAGSGGNCNRVEDNEEFDDEVSVIPSQRLSPRVPSELNLYRPSNVTSRLTLTRSAGGH